MEEMFTKQIKGVKRPVRALHGAVKRSNMLVTEAQAVPASPKGGRVVRLVGYAVTLWRWEDVKPPRGQVGRFWFQQVSGEGPCALVSVSTNCPEIAEKTCSSVAHKVLTRWEQWAAEEETPLSWIQTVPIVVEPDLYIRAEPEIVRFNEEALLLANDQNGQTVLQLQVSIHRHCTKGGYAPNHRFTRQSEFLCELTTNRGFWREGEVAVEEAASALYPLLVPEEYPWGNDFRWFALSITVPKSAKLKTDLPWLPREEMYKTKFVQLKDCTLPRPNLVTMTPCRTHDSGILSINGVILQQPVEQLEGFSDNYFVLPKAISQIYRLMVSAIGGIDESPC